MAEILKNRDRPKLDVIIPLSFSDLLVNQPAIKTFLSKASYNTLYEMPKNN